MSETITASLTVEDVTVTAEINTAARGPAGVSTWDGITGTASAIPFEPVTAPAHAEGTVFYDSTDKSLTYYTDEPEVSMNIGREMWIRVRNNSGATIGNGKVVYLSGATGQLPTIALARADSILTSRVIGLATHDIENNSFGYVTTVGEVKGLDTSAFSDGDLLYLSAATAGAVTTTAPSVPNRIIQVATVAHAHPSQGKLYCHPETDSIPSTGITDSTATGRSLIAAADANAAREAIVAQSRAVGFYDRFDRSDRYAEGATITANTTTPETGGWAYRVTQSGATAPTVTSGALECASDTLYYLSNRVATPAGRFSLGLVIEMERTSVFATAVNNGAFNVTIGPSQLIDDAGSIVAGLATNPIHVNFTINGITSAELYASGGSTALTCLNATQSGGVFPWNSDGSYLPVGSKIALLFEVEGDILRITAAGLGYLEFTHPDISNKVGATYTYFWFEPSGPLLGTDYKHVARLYRWWAMAEELNQLASHGTLPGIGGPRRIDGQLRLFPEGRTSRLTSDNLPGVNTAAVIASSNGTVAKGTHNRVTGGEAIFEGPVIHNFGYTSAGGSISGFMVGSVDSNLNTPTSSSAGVETNISGGGFIPTWGLENGDWESWFFAGQLVGTSAKRIRLFAEYAGGGVPGNIIDSDASGTPLTAVTGFWTLDVKRYTTSTASHIFYAELKANGVLIAAKRTTANHTTNYFAGNLKTTTADAGGVTLDTSIRQIARVNVT